MNGMVFLSHLVMWIVVGAALYTVVAWIGRRLRGLRDPVIAELIHPPVVKFDRPDYELLNRVRPRPGEQSLPPPLRIRRKSWAPDVYDGDA